MSKDDFDPYDALGVESDAGTEEIKRSFRRKAKSSHPDAGGTAEAFGRVQRAYGLLSSPERRRRFDETGEDVGSTIDGIAAEALSLIGMMLGQILSNNPDPFKVDLVAVMRDHVNEEISGIKAQIVRMKEALKRTKKMIGRFKKRKGNNHINVILEVRARDEAKALLGPENAIAVRLKVIEILKDYSFEVDKPIPQPPAGTFILTLN